LGAIEERLHTITVDLEDETLAKACIDKGGTRTYVSISHIRTIGAYAGFDLTEINHITKSTIEVPGGYSIFLNAPTAKVQLAFILSDSKYVIVSYR